MPGSQFAEQNCSALTCALNDEGLVLAKFWKLSKQQIILKVFLAYIFLAN
jgi:hypothetical protein